MLCPWAPRPVVDVQSGAGDDVIGYDAQEPSKFRSGRCWNWWSFRCTAWDDRTKFHAQENGMVWWTWRLVENNGTRGDGEGVVSQQDDVPVGGTFPKFPRLNPESSPNSSSLFVPHYAGNGKNLTLRRGVWRSNVFWTWEFWETRMLKKFNLVFFNNKVGHDSRVRNGRWITRTRYVARELKGACRRNSTSFSPTSGIGPRLVVMLHICFNWFASFLDLKNACPVVPRQEPVLVKKSTWWVSRDGTDDGEFWSSQVASKPWGTILGSKMESTRGILEPNFFGSYSLFGF